MPEVYARPPTSAEAKEAYAAALLFRDCFYQAPFAGLKRTAGMLFYHLGVDRGPAYPEAQLAWANRAVRDAGHDFDQPDLLVGVRKGGVPSELAPHNHNKR